MLHFRLYAIDAWLDEMAMNNVLTRGKKKQARSLLQVGHLHEAKKLLSQICQIDKMDAEAWFLLGLINCQLGLMAEATDCSRRAIAVRPDVAEAHNNLGNALLAQGQYQEAAASFVQAIKIKPGFEEAHNNLGSAYLKLGRLEEAAASFREALRLRPGIPEAHFNLGNVYLKLGRLEEAAASFREALKFRPDFAEAFNNLANVLQIQGRIEEAVTCSRQALRIKPDFAEAHNNYGNMLLAQGRLAEGAECFRLALRLKPDFVEAHHNLGAVCLKLGRLEEAAASFREVFRISPDYIDAYNNQANVLLAQGHLTEALGVLRQALQRLPDNDKLHSNLLLALNYFPEPTAETMLREHRSWETAHARPSATLPAHANSPDPERRLRIGYVSADFRTHSVAYFIEPLLAAHDRTSVEVVCYVDVSHPDATTKRLRGLADQWRVIVGLRDGEVAKLIRSDGIDILVDLSGHTSGNRLKVFAHKPAPVQVTYLGYPNTTGLSSIDYRITDAMADPPELEAFYTEKSVRLPGCFLCYQPPVDCPPVSSLPASEEGYVTFGSFNNLAKINPTVVMLWAELLKTVPGSRLLLKNSSFTDRATRERYHGLFEEYGVPRERIDLLGYALTSREHLALYHDMDIALDTFPYNGTTTTCEALWMGVPVITLMGSAHAGRVGASLLNTVGLTEWIAETPDQYVAIAADRARDLQELAECRAELRERFAASPLRDGKVFARKLETAYRQMWRNWCSASVATTSVPNS